MPQDKYFRRENTADRHRYPQSDDDTFIINLGESINVYKLKMNDKLNKNAKYNWI